MKPPSTRLLTGSGLGEFFFLLTLIFRAVAHSSLLGAPREFHSQALYCNGLYQCLTPGCQLVCTSSAEFNLHQRTWAAHMPSSLTYIAGSYHSHPNLSFQGLSNLGQFGSPIIGDNVLDQIPNYPVLQNTQYDPNTVFTSSSDSFDGAGQQRFIEAVSSHNTTATPANDSDTGSSDSTNRTDMWEETTGKEIEKIFVCPQKDCSASFKRSWDLSRHEEMHQPPAFHCLEPGCRFRHPNGFYRRDKLIDHQRTKHGLGLKHARWGFSQHKAPSNGVTEVLVASDKLNWDDRNHLNKGLKGTRKYLCRLSNDEERCLWYSEADLEGYNATGPH